MSELLATQQLDLKMNDKIICQNLNVTFSSRQIWAILGCNGRGKTTLLHTLAALHVPQRGCVTLKQQPLNTLSRNTIGQNIGLLLQEEHIFFPTTVINAILLGSYPHQNKLMYNKDAQIHSVQEIIKAFDLHDLQNRCITTLSGGEKRRVSIARLLVQQPKIYLLDEPTHHLDPYYQQYILHYFQNHVRNHDSSVIMSLHDINLVHRFCDHVLMMFDSGEIIMGTVEDVLTQHNIEKLYRCKMSYTHDKSESN